MLCVQARAVLAPDGDRRMVEREIVLMTAVMLACYLLWARADLLLSAGPPGELEHAMAGAARAAPSCNQPKEV